MAGKQRYTPQQVAAALKKSHGLQFLAAKALGCSHDTIARYIQRYALVRDVAEAQRGELIDLAEDKLLQSIKKGEAWGITLCLKTLGKDRGYVERQEQTGADGKPLQQEMVIKVVYVNRSNGLTAGAPHRAGALPAQSGETQSDPGGPAQWENNGHGDSGR